MKKIILSTLVMYLSFTFVIWEYNPVYWQQEDRLMFVLILISTCVILWLIDKLFIRE
jgi:hypothetical protein